MVIICIATLIATIAGTEVHRFFYPDNASPAASEAKGIRSRVREGQEPERAATQFRISAAETAY